MPECEHEWDVKEVYLHYDQADCECVKCHVTTRVENVVCRNLTKAVQDVIDLIEL
jgi:hypothetical protein